MLGFGLMITISVDVRAVTLLLFRSLLWAEAGLIITFTITFPRSLSL